MKQDTLKKSILKISLCVLVLLGGFLITQTNAQTPKLTLDLTKPGATVSPMLYGLMTEEINHSYDGGLYAELIRNRAFLDDQASPAHWTAVQRDGAEAVIAL